jgi:predicted RNA-binding protein associated with RNAse of E/G family
MQKKIHLIYKRIPNRVLERDDEVIADLGNIVVAKSKFSGMLAPLFVNGVKVIDNGYKMVYFAFVGKNYDILKVYDEEGNFKGMYIDVLAYTKRYGDTIEMLDLFLDVFVFPIGEAFLLDEDELEMALNYGLIDRKTFEFAYQVAQDILEKLKRKEFPPEIVWEYEWGD